MICAAAALVGPLLSFVATRAYSIVYVTDDAGVVVQTNEIAQAVISTLIDTGALLCPPQLLGTIEYRVGPVFAEILLDGMNVGVHLLLGLLIVFAARSKWGLATLCFGIGTYLFVFSWWGAGYDLRFVSWGSVLISGLFYCVLVMLGMRVGSPVRPNE